MVLREYDVAQSGKVGQTFSTVPSVGLFELITTFREPVVDNQNTLRSKV